MEDPVHRISDPDLEIVLKKIRESMGDIILSSDLQETIPGFRTQKGIYKPQSSQYALWIRETVKGPYPDQEPLWLPDGSWLYRYTPEGRNGKTDLNLGTNQALMNSLDNRVPIGVFRQKNIPGMKRTYEVMGLAYVEGFDGTHFIIHGESIESTDTPMKPSSIKPFQPFEVVELNRSVANPVVRLRAYQTAVRRIYHERCSLCDLGYHFQGRPIGVEAAHVIPVEDRGTSRDIRNGILLCKNHHDLFDRYLWTFDEDYMVHVSYDPLFRKSALKNHIPSAEGKRLQNLPDSDYDLPAIEAIRFRFERFSDVR